jgi:hypothetical protein
MPGTYCIPEAIAYAFIALCGLLPKLTLQMLLLLPSPHTGLRGCVQRHIGRCTSRPDRVTP